MSPINRREFLKRGTIAAAAVSLSTQSSIGRSLIEIGRPASGKRVLILGAGMAGLVAGYELTQLGHDVTIIEARMRPGGRAHTLREPFSDGLYAEAGAARIPDDHDLTLKYANLLNVGLEPMYPPKLSALRFDNGPRREVGPEGFTEALGKNFGDELGGDPKRWQKIKGGTDMLPKAFAQKLADKIHYGSPVVRLDQDAKSARAIFLHGGSQEIFSADRILCTIPFSVLRTIELPTTISEVKRNLIQSLRYDNVSRVYLQTKNRFYENKGLSGFAFTSDAVEIWQPTWSQPGPRGILMTYARPGQAEIIGALKEPDRIKSVLAQMDQIFPGTRENFEGGASKVWADDEWSRGAWAFVFNFAKLAAPEGRIHFAGEHLSQWSSWMQGALSSGLRAVKEINEAAS